MSGQDESSRTKVIAIVQTLAVGALLAALGFWFNTRLEVLKNALAARMEFDRSRYAAMSPITEARRLAYVEFKHAARRAKSILDPYFGFATEDDRLNELESIEQKLSGGGGSSGSFASNEDAIGAVRDLINVRAEHEDVASEGVKRAFEVYIDTTIRELKDRRKLSEGEAYRAARRMRLEAAFAKLNRVIDDAMGLDRLPIR